MGQPQHPIEVVVLVSSAGGLEAMTTVLRGLSADLGVPVVVQQHLSGSGSALADLLSRRTGITAGWASADEPLSPGRVVVTPPRKRIEFYPDGTYAVRDAEAGARELPHDATLRSLADSFGDRALAVVLTGMGSDAADGVRAVKQAGGVVIAQSAGTAEHPSMPLAAAEAGADLVLPLHAIARVVADVVAGHAVPRPDEEDAVRCTFGERGEIARLAQEIDWTSTPLGAVRSWPEPLRAAVRLAMESPHGVTLYLGDDHIVVVNDVGVRSMGGHHREVFGRPYAEVYPDTVDYTLPVVARARAGEQVYHEATPVTFEKHGRLEESWFDMSYTPVRAVDGTVLGVQQTFLDRTSEVLSRRRLQTLNRLAALPVERNRTAALAAAIAVLAESDDVPLALAYLLDRAHGHASLAAATGVEPGSSIAPHRLALLPGAVWPLQQVVDDGSTLVLDDLADRFRGHRIDRLPLGHAVLHPLRSGGDGRPVGVLVVGVHPRLPFGDGYREFVHSVSEVVAAKVHEAQARQRERETIDRLAELDRVKTEFFSNVSHEFRTPLTLMLGPLEDVLQPARDLPADVTTDLELVRRNARRLLRLVGSILDFSQLEAGRLRAQFEPTDLGARTREIVAQFDSAAARAKLRLTVSIDAMPEPVWVDPEMWEKIVSNLLSNALKFTFDGEIDVSLRALPKHAELVVRDTGVGIPKDELPFVFTRFHRVRGTRARTHEGAGIGLALVDELVRRHHGRIRATSDVGSGSAFTVWIPLGRRPTAPSGRERPVGGAVAAVLADEATHWDTDAAIAADVLHDAEQFPAHVLGASVLAVDDNPDMREYLTRLLGANWTVTVARNGTEALELARRNPPDLVLSDVMMPGIDGFELLRELRADERLAATPVVLVTARAGEEAAIEGLLAGADDYVVKPFSARELLARVGAQLELARLRHRTSQRQKFLLQLSDALRPLTDPTAIHATATRLLRNEFDAGWCAYAELDGPDRTALVLADATRDELPSLVGRYDVPADFLRLRLDRS